ncbi:response regulator [Pseudoalteromonas sp. T1lg48]|uniref:response regulator n=1 Tax=Pseudoalteromonas sp. T1lg48 TaxID=2077100 RepID=UPI000CF619BF|nr:response regulator [Pseudoalteromonas sp. T1lg48]
MSHTIVIVEDDAEIAEIVTLYLQADGFTVKHFDDGASVADWIKTHSPALLLLDLDLPTVQGSTVCKQVREFSTLPIIMTTAKVDEVDRLIGLEIGADDYVCKPYSVKELVARVKVNLRRIAFSQQPNATTTTQIAVDEDTLRVCYQLHCVQLSAIEFRILQLLYAQPERVYNRQQILDNVYHDYRDVSDRTVDSHIRNVRKKLSQLPIGFELIQSIYGAGYKYQPMPI